MSHCTFDKCLFNLYLSAKVFEQTSHCKFGLSPCTLDTCLLSFHLSVKVFEQTSHCKFCLSSPCTFDRCLFNFHLSAKVFEQTSHRRVSTLGRRGLVWRGATTAPRRADLAVLRPSCTVSAASALIADSPPSCCTYKQKQNSELSLDMQGRVGSVVARRATDQNLNIGVRLRCIRPSTGNGFSEIHVENYQDDEVV